MSVPNTTSAAFKQGYNAYKSGDSCPFSPTEENNQWNNWWNGYEAAEYENSTFNQEKE
jgi:ribosome modulation factor